MLSRVADSLYWMSRYMERSDGIIRMLKVNYASSQESVMMSANGSNRSVLQHMVSNKENPASIINNITSRSLILLDEIGRGTSTYDGISIAWSIAEHLHQSSGQPRTLFATHYHELNELEEKFPRVKN